MAAALCSAPVNERLKRMFSQFRIGWADEDTIAVLPVLRPDVIETHAAPDGKVLAFGPDWRIDPESVSSNLELVQLLGPAR